LEHYEYSTKTISETENAGAAPRGSDGPENVEVKRRTLHGVEHNI